MTKGGRRKKRSKSPWMIHVAKMMAKMPGVALKDVLRAASKTYKKGKKVTTDVTAKALRLRKGRRRVRRRTRRRGRKRTRRRRRHRRRRRR